MSSPEARATLSAAAAGPRQSCTATIPEASKSGLGSSVIQQPTAGKFPVTMTRKTIDGKFELKQVWAKPDFAEKEITVTMTVKNISGAAIADVYLSRHGDFDVGTTASNHGAKTLDSGFLWNDPYSGRYESTIKTGVMLSTGSLAVQHFPHVETRRSGPIPELTVSMVRPRDTDSEGRQHA